MISQDNPIEYELVVTRLPGNPDGMLPTYECFIYRSVWAGVCGPFTETELVDSVGTAVEIADQYGFAVDGWPSIHRDTATYRLIPKGA